MMGTQNREQQLFSYAVNLEKRVRANHPLRRVKADIDLSFVREEVAHCYGKNGNESVAPEVILKMMFLLFFDDVASQRELMEVIGERLDYLWFLDYGLDVCGMRVATSMYSLFPWTHCAKTRKTSAPGCSTCSSRQPCGTAGPQTATSFDGTQFC